MINFERLLKFLLLVLDPKLRLDLLHLESLFNEAFKRMIFDISILSRIRLVKMIQDTIVGSSIVVRALLDLRKVHLLCLQLFHIEQFETSFSCPIGVDAIHLHLSYYPLLTSLAYWRFRLTSLTDSVT